MVAIQCGVYYCYLHKVMQSLHIFSMLVCTPQTCLLSHNWWKVNRHRFKKMNSTKPEKNRSLKRKENRMEKNNSAEK